jgi:hypothetical protein
LALVLAQLAPAQSAAAKKAIRGPRALGMVELTASGKAHLVPITILYDGEYYDASAYKAAPIPMALESGTVYEGFRTGVSQGLFTVTGALQGNNTWLGAGTWQSASAIAAAKDAAAKKKAVMSKPAPEPPEGPPVLRRASPKGNKAPEDAPSAGPAASGPASPSAPAPANAPAVSTPSAPPDADADSDRPVLKRPAPATAPAASTAAPAPPAAEEDSDRPVLKRPEVTTAQAGSAPPPSDSEPPDDPNRPVLKRGAPTPADLKKRNASVPTTASPKTAKDLHKPSGAPSVPAEPVQLIAAISDAAGPDPRPYAYSLKPDEELKLRKKILAMAADEVRGWAAQPESVGSPAAHASRPVSKAKPPEPSFEDVQLHAFDLSNSNEPVVVLTAKARMPVRPNTSSDLQYIITLVARDDMYGDLHKVFASVTDTNHFDVLSRLELIDAVDADGDGRGELLFRQVSDSGSAFVLYRVIGDKLWALFQGTPGQ